MRILGIETSFDETGVSIVEDGTKIISNVLATSQKLHEASGGVIPEKAARAQVKFMLPTLDKALKDVDINSVDTVAVTYGPGLIGSLLVGVETAKVLAYVWKKPLVPVNHLVAHLYACWLSQDGKPQFPIVALVVSGAHTDLVHMKNHGEIKLLGSTRDDAAGEAFDKCARLLGLPYPGGPVLSATADQFLISKPERPKIDLFPRPMINSDDYDFSFSGLKTSVLNYTKLHPDFDKQLLAANIQEAIVDVLIEKSIRAIHEYSPTSFLLSGGVAANSRLKEKFMERFKEEKLKTKFFAPLPQFATDNAAVIASAAYFNYKPIDWKNVVVDPELTIIS
mgnify:CR=1 FL=1